MKSAYQHQRKERKSHRSGWGSTRGRAHAGKLVALDDIVLVDVELREQVAYGHQPRRHPFQQLCIPQRRHLPPANRQLIVCIPDAHATVYFGFQRGELSAQHPAK